MSQIEQRAQDVRSRYLQAKVGDRVHASPQDEILTGINKAPQAAKVVEVTVDTATNDATYTITVEGVDVTYTADSSTSKIEIADGLADAVNQEPLVRGQVKAESDGVDKVTLTGLIDGYDFTFSESDSNLSNTTATSAAEADAIEFGRMLVQTGYGSDEADNSKLVRKPTTSYFSAQVDTLEVPYVASVEYTIGVRIGGQTYEVQSTADTNQDTTITNLKAALNAVLPANTVVVTDDDSGSNDAENLIFTAEIAGDEFEVYWGTSDDGASHPAISLSSTKGPDTSLALSAFGVALYASDEEVTTVGGTAVSYPANAGVKALRKGQVWVESEQSPSFGDDVYVELDGSGSDAGKFYTTNSSTRVKLAAARWERDGRSGDDIAALKIDL